MSIIRIAGFVVAWLLAVLFSVIGLINVGWGNDQVYGLFLICLSAFFYPPVRAFILRRTGFRVPVWLMILLALFIVWSSLGVGELFDKVDMMCAAWSV